MEEWEGTVETVDMKKLLHGVFTEWITRRIYGSPVARATEAYNYLREVLPELESAVLSAIKKG